MAACADDNRQCKVCFDSPRTVVFQPCSHLVCCPACAHRVDSCPVCRLPIQRRDRLADPGGDVDLADCTFDMRREVVAEEPTFVRDADAVSLTGLIDDPSDLSRSNGSSHWIENSTGTPIWVKVIKGVTSKKDRERTLREVYREAASISHCNLVRLCGGFIARNETIRVIQEFMDLGSLADMQMRHKRHSRSLPPEMQACMFSQVIEALIYVHKMQLIYNELEPESILHNSQGDVKLSYLPCMCMEAINDWRMGLCFAGSVKTYLSPERCMGEDYSFESDSWSVGILTYELATGSYPFETDSFPTLFEGIAEKPEPRLDAEAFSPELCDFAARCLTRDTCLRAAASELRVHPFLTKHAASKDDLAHWLVSPETEIESVVQ
mmetsp:Transcript_45153/g.81573  ORF Transcript_45153/g.81573 Transcript_45153/m.81573 type:complete len:380 (+) Transcript_45153:60-1199(+)